MSLFQSTPDLKVGRYEAAKAGLDMVMVFQSMPDLKAGRYRMATTVAAASGGFNPRPT